MTIPPGLQEYALCLAQLRVDANRDRYRGTDKHRGGHRESLIWGRISNELWTEAIGILGELLARHEVDTSGRWDSYRAGTLLSPAPSDRGDILVGTIEVAVKATEGNVLRVNKGAHERGSAERYAFYTFTRRGEYERHDFTHNTVSSWPTKSAWTEYYECKI